MIGVLVGNRQMYGLVINIKKQISIFLKEHRGKGTCDGVFRKKRFFTCDPNCGVFVPLHKIRADPSSRHAVTTASLRQEIAECGLRITDRIVWLSDNGPEFGEVKWVGVLPDSRRNDITVGVEFVSTCII